MRCASSAWRAKAFIIMVASMSNAFFMVSELFSAAKFQTESEIILKWVTFFRLFELYRESVLVFNELVIDFEAVFCANGFGDGQSETRGMGVFAFSVEGLEHGFGIQGLVFARVSYGQGVVAQGDGDVSALNVVDEGVFQQVVYKR